MPHTYIELFLPEDIRTLPFFNQPRLTSKIALESLNGFNKLSNQERITILNQLIKQTDFAEAQEAIHLLQIMQCSIVISTDVVYKNAYPCRAGSDLSPWR